MSPTVQVCTVPTIHCQMYNTVIWASSFTNDNYDITYWKNNYDRICGAVQIRVPYIEFKVLYRYAFLLSLVLFAVVVYWIDPKVPYIIKIYVLLRIVSLNGLPELPGIIKLIMKLPCITWYYDHILYKGGWENVIWITKARSIIWEPTKRTHKARSQKYLTI